MRIHLSRILVDDQDKALDFYTNVLGFTKQRDVDGEDHRWLSVASPEGAEGIELVLAAASVPPAREYQRALYAAGRPITAFFTDDIEAEYERLKGRGVAFRGAPQDLGPVKAALFEDTCGNLVNLVQPM